MRTSNPRTSSSAISKSIKTSISTSKGLCHIEWPLQKAVSRWTMGGTIRTSSARTSSRTRTRKQKDSL